MSLQDPSARQDRATPRRSPLRDLFRRRPRPRSRSVAPVAGPRSRSVAPVAGPSARIRRREARRLTTIDRRLAAETPQLASMFAIFNGLNAAERTGGAETLPPPARRRPHPLYLAVLVSLAAVAALCFALASQVQAVARPCAGASAVNVSASAAVLPIGANGCTTYATNSGGHS